MQLDLKRVVTLDYETYFDKEYSLRSKEMNTSEYIRDERFLSHCVSLKDGTGPSTVYWYDDILEALARYDWADRDMLCHNTAFDGLICSHHYNIIPHRYLDTLSMGRALHSNMTRASLEALCAFYGMPGKNPNILGRMRGHREIPPEIREEAQTYCAGDTDKCQSIFAQMIAVYPDEEIELIDWTIRQFCDPVLRVDHPRAEAELARQAEKREAAFAAAGVSEEELQSAKKFAAQLRTLGVEPPMKKSVRTNLDTFAFSQQDEEFMELVTHENKDVRTLMAARLAAKSTIGQTRAERFVKINGHPLPVGLNYWGAHTGRWSGSNKMNLQNLEKEELDDENKLVPYTGELRKSIIAPPGHVLVVGDSAQIECRLTAWLFGQEWLLDLFRDNGDPYCALASDIYKRPITKADRDPRAVGKAGVLGLGFYMGAPRFQATLALGILGPKMEVSREFAQGVVDAYRKKNDKIVAGWADMGEIISDMWKKRYRLNKIAVSAYRPGVLEYDAESVWLPNGMGLHYPELGCEETSGGRAEYSYRSNNEYVRLHPGVLTENVIQALARVAIGQQLLRVNERYRVVMMTHDELVLLAPAAEADEALAFLLHEMSQPPAWAPDLPLKAEGGWALNYSK